MLINRKLDKKVVVQNKVVVHIYNGVLLDKKKRERQRENEILPVVTAWIDLGGIMLNKINQSEKDKYYVISFICGI